MAIYTLRGDCGSVRVAARIVGGRVYSEDQSYQANGGVAAYGVIRVSVAALVDPHRVLAGYRTTPAQDVGGRREENAPGLGQRRDALAITERLREIVWYYEEARVDSALLLAASPAAAQLATSSRVQQSGGLPRSSPRRP